MIVEACRRKWNCDSGEAASRIPNGGTNGADTDCVLFFIVDNVLDADSLQLFQQTFA